jgi:hypothetical protein
VRENFAPSLNTTTNTKFALTLTGSTTSSLNYWIVQGQNDDFTPTAWKPDNLSITRYASLNVGPSVNSVTTAKITQSIPFTSTGMFVLKLLATRRSAVYVNTYYETSTILQISVGGNLMNYSTAMLDTYGWAVYVTPSFNITTVASYALSISVSNGSLQAGQQNGILFTNLVFERV